MKTIIKIVTCTTIALVTTSCSVAGQMGSFVDRQSSTSKEGLRSYGQNLSDIIYTGKSRGRGENEKHETYDLRRQQNDVERQGLAWKLRKYLRGDSQEGGQ